MVQFYDLGPQTFLEKLGAGLGNAAQTAGQLLPEYFQKKQQKEAISKLLGPEVANLPEEFQKQFIINQGKSSALSGNLDLPDYDTVKNTFGDQFADLYKAAPTGGKTKLLDFGLSALGRGYDVNQLLHGAKEFLGENNLTGAASEMNATSPEEIKKESPDQLVKKDTVPEYRLNTQGLNPKEVNDYKKDLRKDNTPIWKDSIDRLSSYKELDRDISTLRNINRRKNLPEGFSTLLINPSTGAPYSLVTKKMSPDTQQWVKTIARQATQAQSSFPGRVTNFDLMAYMRQFPNLFNSYEGREIILEQMELTNKAHQIFEDALGKVYKKYKLSGIAPEDAEDLAHQMVDKQIAKIDEQLSTLSFEGEKLSDMNLENSAKGWQKNFGF